MDDAHRPDDHSRRKRWLLGLALALVLLTGVSFLLPSFGQEFRDPPTGDFEFEPSGLYQLDSFIGTDSRVWVNIKSNPPRRLYLFAVPGTDKWEIEVQFASFVQRIRYSSREEALKEIEIFKKHLVLDAEQRGKKKN